MSEADLVRACLAYLTAQGCMVWRNNTGCSYYGRPGRRARFVRFGPVGASDILGCLPDGRALAVECKRGKNVPTYAQVTFLKEIRKHGGIAWWVTSVEQLEKVWTELPLWQRLKEVT